jgi:uncharacterized phage infection (PIP) family protein YhgE
MPEERNRGTPDRQASWVALRTLRQRPTVVGQTEDGATVYEIRSVRLVLPQGSAHFKRLMQCAKCGRDVPGSSILTPADLDHPANPMFCDRCVRSPVPPRPDVRGEGAGSGAAQPVAGGQPLRRPEPDAARRLEWIEARLAKVMSQLPSPGDTNAGLKKLSDRVAAVLLAQNGELEKISASVAQVRTEMRQLADRPTAQVDVDPGPAIEAALARELTDVRAAVAAMVEASAQPLQATLAEGLDQLRSQVAALQQRVDAAPAPRPETSQITEAIRQLAQAQSELHQRMRELAARVDASRGAEGDVTLAGELADVRAGVAAMVDASVQPLHAALGDGLDQVRAQVGALQQRVDEEPAARAEMMQLAETNRALAQAQGDLDERLRELAAQLAAPVEPVPGPEIEATLTRELADVRAGMAAMVDASVQPLQAALADGLDQLGALIAALKQQRIDDEAAARAEAQVAETNRALAQAQGDLDQIVRDLAARIEAGPGPGLEVTLTRELADVRAGMAAMVDASAQPLQAAVADGLDQLRAQVAAVQQQRIDDEAAARAEIAQVAETNRALAQAQGDLDQRVCEVAAQVAALPGDEPDAVKIGDLEALRADVAATIGAEDAHLRVELAEGLDLVRAEIASLEQRVRDERAAVAALLRAQREELTAALHDVAHETLMSVAEPLRDLTRAREEFERRLEDLQRRAQEDERRVEALNATASAGASRLHALEQRLHVSVQRLIHPAGTGAEGQEPPPAPQVQRRAPGALMESLEAQLREAEERLSGL